MNAPGFWRHFLRASAILLLSAMTFGCSDSSTGPSVDGGGGGGCDGGGYDNYGWSVTHTVSGGSLESIWSSSKGEVVMAVGANGLIVEGGYSDKVAHWQLAESGTTADLKSVWGTIYASGFSTLYRFMAVGTGGTIIRGDTTSWAPVQSGVTVKLSAVWGRENVFYAVGEGGTILRYSADKWSPMSSGVTVNLNAVWGTYQGVFAVGDQGTILHTGGKAWHVMTSGVTTRLTGVWGTADNFVFAVGENGVILHYDGSKWKRSRFADYVGSEFLTSVWGMSGSLMFAGTPTGIYSFEFDTTKTQSFVFDYCGNVTGGHSIGQSGVAVTKDGEILVYYP